VPDSAAAKPPLPPLPEGVVPSFRCGEIPKIFSKIDPIAGREMFSIIVRQKSSEIENRQNTYARVIAQLQSIKILNQNEADALLLSNDELVNRVKNFVADVCMRFRFVEVSSSGGKTRELQSSQDWAEAILDFLRRADLHVQSMDLALNQHVGNGVKWAAVCSKSGSCPEPCSRGRTRLCQPPETSSIPKDWTSYRACRQLKTC
jgi:hypothetical protein